MLHRVHQHRKRNTHSGVSSSSFSSRRLGSLSLRWNLRPLGEGVRLMLRSRAAEEELVLRARPLSTSWICTTTIAW